MLRIGYEVSAVDPVVDLIQVQHKRRREPVALLHQRGEIYYVSVVILPVKEIPAFADGRFRRIWHSFIDGDNFPVHIDLDKIVVGRVVVGRLLARRVDNARRRIGHRGQIARKSTDCSIIATTAINSAIDRTITSLLYLLSLFTPI